MSETRDALIDLVKSPGWDLFVTHCRAEWSPSGTRYHAEMAQALNEPDSKVAHLKALQIVAAQRLVEALLGWPGQEAARLARTEEPVGATSLQRGGYHR